MILSLYDPSFSDELEEEESCKDLDPLYPSPKIVLSSLILFATSFFKLALK